MDNKSVRAAVAASALAGAIALGVSSPANAAPSSISPVSNEEGISVVSAVTPAVGVDFRDENGNRTGSGLSNLDQFEYLNAKRPGINGDGTLIKVRQITQGKGGWGSLYEGWIPVKYTQAPGMFFS